MEGAIERNGLTFFAMNPTPMIKLTRITVDHATREVLDQLSAQLALAPAWAAALSDRIQEDVREAAQQSQTTANRRFDALADGSRQLHGQLAEQSVRLAELLDLVGAAEGRIAEQERGTLEGVRQLMQDTEQHQRERQVESMLALVALSASAQAVESQIAAQQESLQVQQRDLAGLLESQKQSLAVAMKHHALLEAVQQSLQDAVQDAQRRQGRRQEEQAQTQAATGVLLHEIKAEQLRQSNALQALCQRLDAMSRPWWEKIFNRNRSPDP